jgi:hypothetical protein
MRLLKIVQNIAFFNVVPTNYSNQAIVSDVKTLYKVSR